MAKLPTYEEMSKKVAEEALDGYIYKGKTLREWIAILAQTGWIPIKTRPMDEDERKEWSEKLGYKLEDYEAVIYTSPLPDDGQDVLICLRSGNIRIDTFEQEDCGCYFVDYGEMDGVVAWMPLPQPWGGKE